MKAIIYNVIALAFFSCSPIKKDNDHQIETKENEYQIETKENLSDKRPKKVRNIQEFDEYKFYDHIYYTTEYGKDLNGEVKSVKQVNYLAVEKFGETKKGKEEENYSMYFDKKGYAVKKEEFENNEEKWVYNHDEKGNLIEKNNYNSEKLSLRYIYKYNDNLTEKNKYGRFGKLLSKWKYTYDKNGYLIQVNEYESDGSINSKEIYKNNENGRVIKKTIYLHEEMNRKIKYKYDENGYLIEKCIYYSDVNFGLCYIYMYNESGYLIEEKLMYEKYNITYEYEFDKQGNWIKRTSYKTEFEFRIPQKIIEREIKYYL